MTGTSAKTPTRCGYCRKEIFKARDGAWYHANSASVSCYFGTGSGKKAFPAGQPREATDTYRENDYPQAGGRPTLPPAKEAQ